MRKELTQGPDPASLATKEKHQHVVVITCNPIIGKAETEKYCRCVGQAVKPTDELQAQWETLSINKQTNKSKQASNLESVRNYT